MYDDNQLGIVFEPEKNKRKDRYYRPKTIGEAVNRIRENNLNARDKGAQFESLVTQTLPALKEYDIPEGQIWSFKDWPDRERLMNRDARDLGIDVVAQRADGGYIAIQCKCYQRDHKIQLRDLSNFFIETAATPEFHFDLLLLVTTCSIGSNVERILKSKQGRWVPYHTKHGDELLDTALRKPREPRPQQQEAIDRTVKGFHAHDRGRLIMACGTGKTFTALNIVEHPELKSRRTLFIAPSIALVGQARREWLRYAREPFGSLIVCSDSSTGKATGSGRDGIDILALECPVTTNPSQVARFLSDTRHYDHKVVFCTYQSLDKIHYAQHQYNAPAFDITIVDEAHRTAGIVRESISEHVGFTRIHNNGYVASHKRLYMTATPRVYTTDSKQRMETLGKQITDMSNAETFGPEFYRLKFKDAVAPIDPTQEPFLTDYRVVVLGIRDKPISREMTARMRQIDDGAVEQLGLDKAILRARGTLLALNGEIESEHKPDLPQSLKASIGFCNKIKVSKWFAEALKDSKLKEQTTRKLKDRKALDIYAAHVDANHNASERAEELDKLASASKQDDECRILTNAKLFSEGVDVPSLDAVIFFEPRKSQVDIVQAVGRIMRRAPGKRFGYIILPIIVADTDSKDPRDMFKDREGYETVGKVLAALQSHDERLAETPYMFFHYVDIDSGEDGAEEEPIQINAFDDESTKHLFAHLMDQIGLGNTGHNTAREIIYSVEQAAKFFDQAGAAERLGHTLSIHHDGAEKNRKHICTTAALLVQNACLLQQRLKDLTQFGSLRGTNGLSAEPDMLDLLKSDWKMILQRDYRPIFSPALKVIDALPDDRPDAIRGVQYVVECANSLATNLDDLGYDHAGPLYHKILGTAESDGAFYTKNPAALLLAELAISANMLDWSDPDVLADFKAIDPACGTGTLLMAATKVIKERIKTNNPDASDKALHKHLVEQGIIGLDINEHAVQLAASNLTLGAPDVDYQKMNFYPMPHGPQIGGGGNVKLGSLELLTHTLPPLFREDSSITDTGARQVDDAEAGAAGTDIIGRCDLVIMNPPFTNNEKRGARYSKDVQKAMRAREVQVQADIHSIQGEAAAGVINANSIQTYFPPLTDKLLKTMGTAATVIPATVCTASASFEQRKYFARHFHIERLVTCHAKKDFSFSGNTDIHECLMVARRWSSNQPKPDTQIVVLNRMPGNTHEVQEVLTGIYNNDLREWGNTYYWPEEKTREGNWSAMQWHNKKIPGLIDVIQSNPCLIKANSTPFLQCLTLGRQTRATFRKIDDVPIDQDATGQYADAVKIFYSKSPKYHSTLQSEPEQWALPRPGQEDTAKYYLRRSGRFLFNTRMRTNNGTLTALYSKKPHIGNGWIAANLKDKNQAKALTVWWNSTPMWLQLLNMRSAVLTWPGWSIAQTRETFIPDLNQCDYAPLIDVFEQIKDTPLKPMKDQANDPARAQIDNIVADMIGIDRDEIAHWRDLLSQEPTIAGE